MSHGGAAPQAREAARLRLVFLLDPALKRLASILKHGDDSHALGAIKIVLDRNELYGFGVEHEAASPAHLTVTTTQVNALADLHVESMSDEELSRYLELLRELRELMPAEEPKNRSVSR